MRIEQILTEGHGASESNVAWANWLKAVWNELSMHRRVQQLLYAAMYAEKYDLNGDTYVSDSASDSDMWEYIGTTVRTQSLFELNSVPTDQALCYS